MKDIVNYITQNTKDQKWVDSYETDELGLRLYTTFMDDINDDIALDIIKIDDEWVITDSGYTNFEFQCHGLSDLYFKDAFKRLKFSNDLEIRDDELVVSLKDVPKTEIIPSILRLIQIMLNMFGIVSINYC